MNESPLVQVTLSEREIALLVYLVQNEMVKIHQASFGREKGEVLQRIRDLEQKLLKAHCQSGEIRLRELIQ